jgi:alpha-1,3-rhamnosyl/mannosyltransferase
VPVTADDRPTIALNALAVNPSNAGSRTMLTKLVPALQQVAPHLRILLVCHPENRALYPADLEDIVVDPGAATMVKRLAYDLHHVSNLVKDKADVLVTPGNVGPLHCAIPQVAIVAAHLVLPSAQRAALPERMPRLKVLYMGWPFRRYLKGATRVLAISDDLARGVVEELGIDPAKVRAMNLGVAPPEGGPSLTGRDDTILFVGTLYKYKDGEGAIRAFARARDRLPATARLVMVGADHNDEAARLRGIIRELGIEDGAEVRGPVSHEELEHLFRTAGVLLMPSKCEGFGLPVAEAMGYGLPVIAADATCLPGVAGGAARLVPPADVDGFADALVEVLTDATLRTDMVERGLRRASELTWEAAAIVLRDAIDDALAVAGKGSGSARPSSGAKGSG